MARLIFCHRCGARVTAPPDEVLAERLERAEADAAEARAALAEERERCARIVEYFREAVRPAPLAPLAQPAKEALTDLLAAVVRAIRSGEPFRTAGESDESFEARCVTWESEVKRGA